ncbi:MAG: hypothetical protein L3J12_04765 [Spirochaetales bacterium]|nr:hypothetical protein [Spirochaetales bacterium]
MAFIKSALEIAMERTRDVKSNPETIKINSLMKEGQKFASEFLFEINSDKADLKKSLDNYKNKDKETLISGLKKTFMSNIHLPKDENYSELLGKIETGLSLISKNDKSVSVMVEQIGQFYSQYLENKIQLIDALKQQYEPRLKQKEQEIASKYGQNVTLSPEQDSEFMEILKSNLGKLESQYNDSLSKAKDELEKMI